jgi:hypothetical protein
LQGWVNPSQNILLIIDVIYLIRPYNILKKVFDIPENKIRSAEEEVQRIKKREYSQRQNADEKSTSKNFSRDIFLKSFTGASHSMSSLCEIYRLQTS